MVSAPSSSILKYGKDILGKVETSESNQKHQEDHPDTIEMAKVRRILLRVLPVRAHLQLVGKCKVHELHGSGDERPWRDLTGKESQLIKEVEKGNGQNVFRCVSACNMRRCVSLVFPYFLVFYVA